MFKYDSLNNDPPLFLNEVKSMNLDKTTKIEEEIVHLPVKELDERIANSKTETDKKFGLTLKNRGLQYQQLKVINQKDFIR